MKSKCQVIFDPSLRKCLGVFAMTLLFLFPNIVNAHKLLIEFTVVRNGVVVEVFFPDGKPAGNVPVRLLQEGMVITKGMTDSEGKHLFSIDKIGDYVVDGNARLGHYAKIDISKEVLTGMDRVKESPARQVSKIKKEKFPIERVFIGILVITLLSGAGFWFSKQSRNAKSREKI